MNEELTFHYPRTKVKVKNWPIGGGKTTTARFMVIRDLQTGLEWASRVTTGKQRQSPRAARVRVVRGSDGRHYVIGRHFGGRCFIMPGTMRDLIYPSIDDTLTVRIREALQ